MPEAVRQAKQFINRAIVLALDFGAGHGPTNHYAHVLQCIADKENDPWPYMKKIP